jgi:hypothetical protein
MPRLPRRRVGSRLQSEQEEVSFSVWPLARGSRRHELQRALFTTNPWEVARAAANLRVSPVRLPEAEAFINQAEELYRAAVAGTRVNPLLLNLAFSNLARALIIVRGHVPPLVDAVEGISEQHTIGWDLHSAALVVQSAAEPTVFELLARVLGLAAPVAGSAIPILDLLPQVVAGHRLYRSATGAPEQFAQIHELQFMTDVMEKTVWVDLLFDSGKLARADLTSAKLLAEGGLGAHFREVESDFTGRRRFEMLQPFDYDTWPWERLDEVIDTVRPHLWTAVGKGPPYRAHHVCLATANRMPQLLSLYLLISAFGGAIRLWPHRFDQLLSEPIGSFVVDFLLHQPEQLLHLLASEFAEREVLPGSGLSQRPGRSGDQLREPCPA